jgi:hypothetical protein
MHFGLTHWYQGSGIELWALTNTGDLYRYNGNFDYIGSFPCPITIDDLSWGAIKEEFR